MGKILALCNIFGEILLVSVVHIFAAPFLLWRYLVIRLAKTRLAPPGIGKILSGFTTAAFAGSVPNDPYTPDFNMLVHVEFDCRAGLSAKQLERRLVDRVLEARDPESGAQLYPEFHQHCFQWFGQLFWRTDPGFQVENHMREMDGSGMGGDLGWSWEKQYINEPFDPLRSPWELTLISNYKDGASALLIKFHHCLADGYSLMEALVPLSDTGPPPREPQLDSRQAPIQESLTDAGESHMNHMWRPIRSPEWHLTSREMSQRRTHAKSGPLSTDGIKESSKNLKVSFSAVVLAAVVKGIHAYSLETKRRLPKHFLSYLTIPPLKHVLGLGNSFIIGIVKLPSAVAAEKDQNTRILFCHDQIESLRKSLFVHLCHLMMNLQGLLPRGMGTIIFNHRNIQYPLVLVSGIPGPLSLTFGDVPVSTIYAVTNNSRFVGLSFLMVSYNGKLQITLSADTHICPEESGVETILRTVVTELAVAAGRPNM